MQEVRGPRLSVRHLGWLRGDCSPYSLKCCLLEREVDLDKTGASLPCGKQQWGQRAPLPAHIALLRPNGKLSLWNTPQPQRDVSGTEAEAASPRLDSHCQRGVLSWFQSYHGWSPGKTISADVVGFFQQIKV